MTGVQTCALPIPALQPEHPEIQRRAPPLTFVNKVGESTAPALAERSLEITMRKRALALARRRGAQRASALATAFVYRQRFADATPPRDLVTELMRRWS